MIVQWRVQTSIFELWICQLNTSTELVNLPRYIASYRTTSVKLTRCPFDLAALSRKYNRNKHVQVLLGLCSPARQMPSMCSCMSFISLDLHIEYPVGCNSIRKPESEEEPLQLRKIANKLKGYETVIITNGPKMVYEVSAGFSRIRTM